jgi:hypothetical protein
MRNRRTVAGRAALALSMAATLVAGLAAAGTAELSVPHSRTVAGGAGGTTTGNTDDDVTHDW